VKPPRIVTPRRVLITQIRRLGDVVLSTVLLEDLRRAFPDAGIDFLVGEGAAPLLDGHPFLSRRILYDRAHPTRTWRLVRDRKYDWIVDPQSSPRTAPLALISGAPVRSGYGVRGWGWVYTHRLPRAGRPVEYVARERQRLLEALGVAVGPPRTRLVVTDAERETGRLLLRERLRDTGRPVVAMVLSSAAAAREWPTESFASLAEMLARERIQSVAFEMPGDADKVSRVRAIARGLVRIATPGLRDFMGALLACDVLVSGSTGPAHIATALGVPRVTIHGPDAAEAWAPHDDPTVIALRADAARTLGTIPTDDVRARALTAAITPAAVMEAVRSLLATRAPGPQPS
jgi:ADP-heptose:LPS heptosyltransferase